MEGIELVKRVYGEPAYEQTVEFEAACQALHAWCRTTEPVGFLWKAVNRRKVTHWIVGSPHQATDRIIRAIPVEALVARTDKLVLEVESRGFAVEDTLRTFFGLAGKPTTFLDQPQLIRNCIMDLGYDTPGQYRAKHLANQAAFSLGETDIATSLYMAFPDHQRRAYCEHRNDAWISQGLTRCLSRSKQPIRLVVGFHHLTSAPNNLLTRFTQAGLFIERVTMAELV